MCFIIYVRKLLRRNKKREYREEFKDTIPILKDMPRGDKS